MHYEKHDIWFFSFPDKMTYADKGVCLGGSVGCACHWLSGGHGFDPCQVWQHSFVETDHVRFSKVVLSSTDSRRAVVSFWQKIVLKYWLTA